MLTPMAAGTMSNWNCMDGVVATVLCELMERCVMDPTGGPGRVLLHSPVVS